MWDLENFLAKGSKQRTDANYTLEKAATVKRIKQLDAAKAIKDQCDRLKLPVSRRIRHFLREGVGRNEAEAPRRFSRRIIDS